MRRTGLWVSTTSTVLVFSSAVLPAASVTLYVIVYVPTVSTSTLPDTSMLSVISVSRLSVAVAPGSVKAVPLSRIMFVPPEISITGEIVSLNVADTTFDSNPLISSVALTLSSAGGGSWVESNVNVEPLISIPSLGAGPP